MLPFRHPLPFFLPPTIFWATVSLHRDSPLNFVVVSDLMWLYCYMGGEKFLGWALVNCFQIAGACGACQSHSKDKIIRTRHQKELVVFIWNYMYLCSAYLLLSGAAKDYRATGLWGCGVSEKGPDTQWPPQRPAALPCGRCLGKSPSSFTTVPPGTGSNPGCLCPQHEVITEQFPTF